MSGCKDLRNEKGIVLVVALLILAVLSLMVFALVYNMTSYLKVTASVREKSQTYYSSMYGLEQIRTWLGNKQTVGGVVDQNCYHNLYANTWCELMPNNEAYKDVTADIATTGTPSFGGVNYKVYFKNNEEGTASEPGKDNDQIVMVSVVATAPDNETKTVVEAMLINTYTAKYAQSGGDMSKGHSTNETGSSVTTFNKF